jgi:hypothetical protein
MTSPPDCYDHVRPTDANDADGVYRVVGVTEERVVLLRVGEADGRRVHTGDLRVVDRDGLDRFEPAANPDGNRPLGAAVASTVSTAHWSLRSFGRQLAARPEPTTLAAAVVLAGLLGGHVGALPDVVAGGLAVVGSLALAYVGSGRS